MWIFMVFKSRRDSMYSALWRVRTVSMHCFWILSASSSQPWARLSPYCWWERLSCSASVALNRALRRCTCSPSTLISLPCVCRLRARSPHSSLITICTGSSLGTPGGLGVSGWFRGRLRRIESYVVSCWLNDIII